MNALEQGFADPRWGGYRQIQDAGGHVRKGEKGTPILYVDVNRRETVRDEGGKPVLDDAGHPAVESVRRDRPLVKLHYVFNVEQTEAGRVNVFETTWFSIYCSDSTPSTPRHRRVESTIDRAVVAAGQRPHAASCPGCRSRVLGHPGGSFSTAD